MMEVRQCTLSDLSAVLELNETVYAALPDKTVLRLNSPEMIASCLEEPNVTIGVWEGERLIALGMLYVPQCLEEDYAHDVVKFLDLGALGFCGTRPLECSDWEKMDLEGLKRIGIVAGNQKLYLVRDGYRGLGLQRRIIRIVEELARQRGLNLLCVTCAPNNSYSIDNFLKEGYRYAVTMEKYGGLTRNLYYKPL